MLKAVSFNCELQFLPLAGVTVPSVSHEALLTTAFNSGRFGICSLKGLDRKMVRQLKERFRYSHNLAYPSLDWIVHDEPAKAVLLGVGEFCMYWFDLAHD